MKVTVECGLKLLFSDFIKALEAVDSPKYTYLGEDKNSRQGGIVFEVTGEEDVNKAIAIAKSAIKKSPRGSMGVFRVIETKE